MDTNVRFKIITEGTGGDKASKIIRKEKIELPLSVNAKEKKRRRRRARRQQ